MQEEKAKKLLKALFEIADEDDLHSFLYYQCHIRYEEADSWIKEAKEVIADGTTKS